MGYSSRSLSYNQVFTISFLTELKTRIGEERTTPLTKGKIMTALISQLIQFLKHRLKHSQEKKPSHMFSERLFLQIFDARFLKVS